MSWDIYAMKFPPDIRDLSELPEDFKPVSIGTPAEVAQAICALFPATDVSSPDHLLLEGPNYCMEISVGEAEACEGIMFFVRAGESLPTVDVIMQITERLAIRAWDISAGEFMDQSSDPGLSFAAWRAYRDKVMKQNE